VVKVLSDEAATRDRVISGFEWLRSEAVAGDVSVAFLSGHGCLERKLYCFVPYDFALGSPRPWYVRCGDILDAFAAFPAAAVLLLDTCYAGGVGEVLNDLFRRLSSDGVWTVAAARESEPAIDDPRVEHGVFTQALLEALEGNAEEIADPDGWLDLSELHYYVSRRVKQLSDGAQHTSLYIPSEQGIPAPVLVARPN
jgi:hypothetical protein